MQIDYDNAINKKNRISKGDKVIRQFPTGKIIEYTALIRSIRCGKKGCTKCPHGPYVYLYAYSEGVRYQKYLGRHAPTKSNQSQED